MADLRDFTGPNAGYILGLYEQYLQNPTSLDSQWQEYFRSFTPPTAAAAPTAAAPPGVDVARVVGAHDLAEAIRAHGHTAAHINPLAPEAPAGERSLTLQAHGISEADLAALPASVVGGPLAQRATNAAEVVAALRKTYCGSIGYEFAHIDEPAERAWLREAVESGRYRTPLTAEEKRALLERLSQVEGFEQYLHKTFFGQKRFSLEGTDAMVPMLDEIVREAGAAGAREVHIGMAHRGRLNVLTHVLEKPYPLMLVGFQGAVPNKPKATLDPHALSGDVKYHMGWRTTRQAGDHEVTVTLAPNPSHLEFVNPVVIGNTRASQDDTSHAGYPTLDASAALAVLVHGDAAFPGQGVVAETLNMSGLPGYTVGGTLHLIANNQIGFTTNPVDDRSTRYSSDLAKGFGIPIVHVNADDAEACIFVARLAHAYRTKFHKDFVIDLFGYRRWGHNEGDEPLFTQPKMYGVIRNHPTAREVFATRLVGEGVLDQATADAMLKKVFDTIGEAHASLQNAPAAAKPSKNGKVGANEEPKTAISAETLRTLNEELMQRPAGFTGNSRLEKNVLEKRRDALADGGRIDWGHAEALAFASLLAEGTPIRITGQDAERGTFSHRHAVLHDAETGEKLSVLASLPSAKASFEVFNSPLSEMAVLGFEYGYAIGDPQSLVLWEAQFGDFANGAQIMIDQFISASFQKWEQTTGLVMLLPHGYEGQGPEHSSARLERFLQLAAQESIRVVNCTTAAQYFHLLRRQAAELKNSPRPLIVMSPKSLLRHEMAAAHLPELAEGHFQKVIGDLAAAEHAASITRLTLCSGKVYVDLIASPAREEGSQNVALGRVEELYPFPAADLKALAGSFPALREIVWVQEEPKNMGAWSYIEPRLRELFPELPVRYEGRSEQSSPAEGSPERHALEQARITAAAWSGAPAAAEKGAKPAPMRAQKA